MTDYDAIVVGGGPAGCAAAIKMAQAGKSVVLLEKQKQAHHKVCGEFLSFETQHYLNELGIDLQALGAVPIHEIQLIRGQHEVTTKLPFDGMSLSRYRLDEALINQAAKNGVCVKRGVEVSTLRKCKVGWRAVTSNNTYNAKSAFLATGKHEMRSMPRRTGNQNDYIGFKMHWRLSAVQKTKLQNQVKIVFFTGGYAGLELVEDGIANLCLIVTKKRFAEVGKKWSLLLIAIFSATPLLKAVFSYAEACWKQPLAISGIPYGFIHNDYMQENEGLYRLGDQIAVIPSFSGDGMAIALHTAAHAVQMFLSECETPYHTQELKKLSAQIHRALTLSRMTASPLGQTIAFSLCRQFPAIIRCIAANTRLEHFKI